MKCPKCGYLGFEPADRCRNCQYDFSLASPTHELDYSIFRESETANPIEDLSLIDAASSWRGRGEPESRVDLDRIIGAPEPATGREPVNSAANQAASASRFGAVEELPL